MPSSSHRSPEEPVISAHSLGVATRRGWVFRDLTFSAFAGSVVALLGPTGSGKTAALLSLAGRMRPTAGGARVCGHDVKRRPGSVRSLVALGVMPAVHELDDELTVREHLAEQLVACPCATPLGGGLVLCRVRLAGLEGRRAGELDVEQRARLGVALALMGDPRVVVVDDLDHDLDPGQQSRLWTLLRDVAEDGRVVLVGCIDPRAAAQADLVVRLSHDNEEAADEVA